MDTVPLHAKEEDAPPERRSYISRLRDLIGIEVAMLLFFMSYDLSSPIHNSVVYQKACIQRFNDVDLCQNLKNGSFSNEEDMVQQDASYWNIYVSICYALPAAPASFLYGAWADRYNRKIPLVLPLIGNAVYIGSFLAVSMVPTWPLWPVLIGCVIGGLCGSHITHLTGTYSYLCVISSTKMRTVRLSLLKACFHLGAAAGDIFGAKLFTSHGYQGPYGVALLILAFLMPYTIFWLKPAGSHTDEPDKKMCSMTDITEAVRCVIRRRKQRHRRMHILLQMAALCVLVLGGEGSQVTVSYLFVHRRPLSWTQQMYNFYLGVCSVSNGLVLLLVMPAMKHFMRLRDTTLFALAIVSNMAGEFLFSVSVQTWMVFLVPVVGFFHPMTYAALRSHLSKMVKPHEQGKMFSVFASVESVSMVARDALLNVLYSMTLLYWPGFCFSFGGIILIIPLVIIIYIHVDLQRGSTGETDSPKKSKSHLY